MSELDELQVGAATPVSMYTRYTQDTEPKRVALNLSQSIVCFWRTKMAWPESEQRRFTANELRQYVNHYNYGTAPASADRVMRNLKKAGKINYEVVNRAKSLYVALPLEEQVVLG